MESKTKPRAGQASRAANRDASRLLAGPLLILSLLLCSRQGGTATTGTPPSLDYHYMPLNVQAEVSAPVAFYVEMSGTAPLSYQWFAYQTTRGMDHSFRPPRPVVATNVVAVSNSNTNTIVLTNASGVGYFVMVTNGFGSFTSQVASLSYFPPPTRPNITVTLSWGAVSNAAIYKAQMAGDVRGPWSAATNTTATSAVWDWLKADHGLDAPRFYRVAGFKTGPPLTDMARLEWDAEAGVNGYRLYQGSESRVYTNSVDVGEDTEIVVGNLQAQPYHFAVTAYDWVQESDPSDEITWDNTGYDTNPIPCRASLVVQQ